MADREDDSSLSAEEKIALALEELGAIIDSQADRLTAKLEPVTRSVAAIEQQLEEMGYGRAQPAAPDAARHDDPMPVGDAPPVDDAESGMSPPDDPVPAGDAAAPGDAEREVASPDDPTITADSAGRADIESQLLDFEAAKSRISKTGSGDDEPEIDEPQLDESLLDEPQLDEPMGDKAGDDEREPPAFHDTEPERREPEATGAGDEAADALAAEGGTEDTAAPSPADLPFEGEGLTEEDLSLADESLKAELEGLFDDGLHAKRDGSFPDPADSARMPPPPALAPKRSRPVYLLVLVLMFLAGSVGFGAFVWLELTSPPAPPVASVDRLTAETPASAARPEAATAPIPPKTASAPPPAVSGTPPTQTVTTPTPAAAGMAPTRTVAPPPPEVTGTPPAPTVAPPMPVVASPPPPPPPPPRKTATPNAPAANANEIAGLPEPELTTGAATATQPDNTVVPLSVNPEVDALRDAAAAGDSVAQNELAIRYLVGRGIEQDYAEAARWLQEAAAGGVVSAQYNLGVLYDSGRGVDADPVEALIWFHSAAEKGHGRAQYALAAAYAAGRGIARDAELALKWLRRAAEKNVLEAQSSLANILATSPVDKDSLKDAYYWYRLADANGDRDAADRADQVAARLTAEERAAVNRRVSAFIAANITGKRPQPGKPAPAAAAAVDGASARAAATESSAPGAITSKPDAAAATPPKAETATTDAAATPTSPLPDARAEQIRRIQSLLTTLGFDPGPADGSLGEKTREAIRGYQRTLGLDIDGEPSAELLAHLLQISGNRN